MSADEGKGSRHGLGDREEGELRKDVLKFPGLSRHDRLEDYFRGQIEILRNVGEALARLATVVRDSNDAIILMDPFGNIAAWNQGAARIYGYSEEEALKMNISSIVPAGFEKADLEMLRKLRESERVESFNTKRVTKDGRVLDVWLTVTALKDEHGQPYAISTTERDITQMNRQQRELKAERDEAAFYLDLISHDIRNFNQAALGYQELLYERPGLDEESRALV